MLLFISRGRWVVATYTGRRRPCYFTLVELLIVVSVLAILAAIGLVSFQVAQARSKVARVESDIRTVFGALEAYRTDHSAYPAAAMGDRQLDEPLVPLTTPVAYLTSIPHDPFGPAAFEFSSDLVMSGYNYKDRATTASGMPGDTYGRVWREFPDKQYFVHSCGPNRVWDVLPYCEYDPTNGVVSRGDICRFGP